KRESVQEVYAKIEEDLEAGLVLISDHHYTVPKYHFNTKAANAFAARFYLYKRDYQKVVQYANKVLGANPINLMRKWDVDYDNVDAIIYDYVSINQAANFLLLPTSSLFGRIYGNRYGHNYDAMWGSTYGSGPTWSTVLPAFDGKLYISVQQDYGVFFPKASEMFEYTDKVAGIGFTHIVRAEFTAEETLLCRAEALIYLNRISEAIADLQVWNSSHLAPEELTLDVINNFYKPNNILFVKGLRNTKMSNQFKITAEQLPLIHCVLHFRRIETMFDGYRWFDIKRYGIEITHNIDGKGLQRLSFDDERRAIQLPQEVISAGMESNPRTMDAQSSEMYEKFKN
ncbi:MAG TPA: RagB/SusD family nutrient uptake outer membrane protein, partial [Paludibacter sp.]|nr:RagB/SusD family nutrient uptake outer membrane protein [Paludibacter sp.]